MFEFLFIWRHKKNILSYIKSVYSPEKHPQKNDTDVRFALPKDTPSFDPNIRFSKKRTSGESTEIKYSGRDEEPQVKFSLRDPEIRYSDRDYGDNYNALLVSSTMRNFMASQSAPVNLSDVKNLGFAEKLMYLIREKDLDEPEVYKAALMDRRLFSKIISNKDYKPAKDTVLALIFAMKLSLKEANDLLDRAGYTLSHSIKRDIVLEYFIKEEVYNLNKINAFLFEMGEKIIGRST